MFTFCSFHKTCREGSQTLRKRGISSFCSTDWNISETTLNEYVTVFLFFDNLPHIYDVTDRLALLWDIWWIFTYNKLKLKINLILSNQMLCTWSLCATAGPTYSQSLLRDIWRQHTTLMPGGPDEDQKWLNLVRPAPWLIHIPGSVQRVRLVPNGKFLPMIRSYHGIRLWSPPDSFVIYIFVYLSCTSLTNKTWWKCPFNLYRYRQFVNKKHRIVQRLSS